MDHIAGGFRPAESDPQIRHPPDDCAAAAAAVLVGDGHDTVAYDIAGPRLLDVEVIAAALAERYGRPVRHDHQ